MPGPELGPGGAGRLGSCLDQARAVGRPRGKEPGHAAHVAARSRRACEGAASQTEDSSLIATVRLISCSSAGGFCSRPVLNTDRHLLCGSRVSSLSHRQDADRGDAWSLVGTLPWPPLSTRHGPGVKIRSRSYVCV